MLVFDSENVPAVEESSGQPFRAEHLGPLDEGLTWRSPGPIHARNAG